MEASQKLLEVEEWSPEGRRCRPLKYSTLTSVVPDGETNMKSNPYQSLGQVSSSDAGQIFRDHLRGCVRQMICEVMAVEVDELCGVKHQPSDSEHFRAGSSPGRIVV